MLMPGFQSIIGLVIGSFLFLAVILTALIKMTNIKTAVSGGSARERMLVEVERLKAGGEFDDSIIRRLTREQRAYFEIILIEALTTGSRESRHRLRAMLIKHGIDDLCARRVMKDPLSDRIRASTLLYLLRPQFRTADLEWDDRGRTGDLIRGAAGDDAPPESAGEGPPKSHGGER